MRRLRALLDPAAALLGAALLVALAGLARALPGFWSAAPPVDFGVYYQAARALHAGQSPYGAGYIYPPFFAGLLWPLAALDLGLASRLWLLVNVAAALALAALATRLLAPRVARRRWFALVLAVLLLIPATYDTMLLGQVNLLIALAVAGALALLLRQRLLSDGAAGALLALAVAIKLYPLALLPILLWRRRAVALGAFALALGCAFGLGMLMGPPALTATYLLQVLPGLAGEPAGIVENQSLLGVLTRAFAGVEQRFALYSAEHVVTVAIPPLVDAPAVGLWLGRLLSLLVYGLSCLVVLRGLRRAPALPLWVDFAVLTPALLLAAPIVWSYYYTLLIIPLVALARWGAPGDPLPRLLMSLGLLLVALQRFWRVLIMAAPSALASAIGFVGVLIIWLVVASYGLAAARPADDLAARPQVPAPARGP